MDLSVIVREGAAEHAQSCAVTCDEYEQSYGRLYERACRLANALTRLDVQRGERVAMLGDNCLELVEQMAGIELGGFVRTGLYAHVSGETNLYLLNLVDAAVLIVQARLYDAIAPYLPHARTLRHVLVFDGPTPQQAASYEDLLAAAPADDPVLPVVDEAPYIIRFSSGTTGKPKGILHTVAGWRAVANEMALAMPPLTREDRYLAAGPLAHAAQLPLAATLAAGGTIVVQRAFEPRTFLETLERRRCTITMLVPTMIQMVAADPHARAADLSSLRMVLYGAAPISEQTLADGRAIWGDIMHQMYGQSEAVPLTVLKPEEHVGNLLRSAGRPTPNTVVRIVDEQGMDVAQGEVGEIAVRTPVAMARIWGDEEATAERLLPDGSLLTRDMGYLDEDGFVFLADRKEDMIISGGFNIWPAELENVLASHPAIAEVAVVGVPHPKWGETPKAVVVLRTGQSATEEELIEWTRARAGAVKRVTSVEFATTLPKSATGKVLRREVKRPYWEDAQRGVMGA